MVPPWDLVPYANCGGTDFVHDIVHIAQTGPQGHFSVGPYRGRGLSFRGFSMLCCLKHVSMLVRASGVCENSAQVTN